MLSIRHVMLRSVEGASNHARRPCRTRLSFRDQFLHTLFRRGDEEEKPGNHPSGS